MTFSLDRWIRISLFNLMLIAIIGIILRYKILYSLPFIDQKHLQHGHSHFAFGGWLSQILMTLLSVRIIEKAGQSTVKKYRILLLLNLITAYGMLVAFPIEGYGLYSIIFSTLSIVVSYFFGIFLWRDLNKLTIRTTSHLWYKAAILFNALSSLGAYSLAIMMTCRISHQNWYLAAEYFFLHFQYNGWFFFVCMGLLYEKLQPYITDQEKLKQIYWMFTLACLPAYLLSTLWMNMPLIIYILVIAAAMIQFIAWIQLVALIKKNWHFIQPMLSNPAKRLLGLSGIALSIKLSLQLGSVIPSLSTLAFGFRPIVIGYLHLVLLGVITLFILGYIFHEKMIRVTRLSAAGVYIFAGGIIFNEILLMTQGIAALDYINIPLINELLFFAAGVLFTGLFILNISQVRKKIPPISIKIKE